CQGEKAVQVDIADLSEAEFAVLRDWFKHPTEPLVASDGKGLAHALKGSGIKLGPLSSDVQLAAYLCKPDARSYETALLASLYLKREIEAAPRQEGLLQIPGEIDDALAEEARTIGDLYAPLNDQL
ncbi:hypothetical protein, partial [Bacillus cereus]